MFLLWLASDSLQLVRVFLLTALWRAKAAVLRCCTPVLPPIIREGEEGQERLRLILHDPEPLAPSAPPVAQPIQPLAGAAPLQDPNFIENSGYEEMQIDEPRPTVGRFWQRVRRARRQWSPAEWWGARSPSDA
jgi:hypothetical protein